MPGPVERGLGGTPTSAVEARRAKFFWFVKITFPSPTGVLRYTDRPGGFVGDIEGSSQTWTAYDVRVGELTQTQQTVLDVSWIEIANNNNVWSTLILNTGIANRPIELWQAWFDPDTDAKSGQNSPFYGRLDKAVPVRGKFKISIVPDKSGFSQQLPARVIGPICGYIFKDTATCQYVGADTACDHTREACRNKSNLAHFGGFDQLPNPNVPITWKTYTFTG